MIVATVDPTTVGMLLTACGILGSAVGFLYKQQSQFHKDTSEKLRDCESDRVALWAELAKQAGRRVQEGTRERLIAHANLYLHEQHIAIRLLGSARCFSFQPRCCFLKHYKDHVERYVFK